MITMIAIGLGSGTTAATLQYVGAAAAYASGTGDGVTAWVRFCAQAVVVGASEGTLVADAVLAGRLAG